MKEEKDLQNSQYFIENLPLRWQHNKEEVLNDPLLFHIPFPPNLGLGLAKKPTLGLLFRAWDRRTEAYSRSCSCGKTGMIFSCVGSPMTGSCSWTAICFDCKNVFSGKDSSFSKLIIRADISDNQPILA